MKNVIKAPNESESPIRIFLAGSIEMDTADRWQDKAIELLNDKFEIFNPRRDDWDNNIKQSIKDENFVEQVMWELSHMERADIILMYFDPNTKSPITMLELGLHSKSNKLMVVCPDGFYRKANVEIVCDMYNIIMIESLEEAIEYINML